MKSFTKRGGFASIFAVLVLVFAPVAVAEPEIRSIDEATVFVNSNDVVWLGGFDTIADGFAIITSPDGNSIEFRTTPASDPVSTQFIFRLNGQQVSGPPNTWFHIAGDLTGSPVDGTWTIEYSAAIAGAGSERLIVGGKELRWRSYEVTTGTPIDHPSQIHTQINWHMVTVSPWTEPGVSSTGGVRNPDPIDSGPEEDPEYARYFRPGPSTPDACSAAAGQSSTTPSGPTVPVDNDGDGLPGSYETPQETTTINADCTTTTTPAAPLVTPGPDPDDNDAENPGATCTPETFNAPTGNVTGNDGDGDGFNGSYNVEYQDYSLDASCNITPTGPPYTGETVTGEDPDDNDPQNPNTNFDPYPFGATADHEAVCNVELNIRGAWIRGQNQVGDTYGYFRHTSGFETDELQLSSETNLINLGAALNGTHNATIPYDNLNGNSYQFIVRNDTGGPDQPGAILYALPQQCNQSLPDLGQFEHNEDEFQVKVSQGQCSVDNTTINVMSDDPVQGNDVLEVYLGNAETGLILLTWTQDDFFEGPAFQYFFLSTYIPPGDYILLATVDAQGLGQNDMFDTVPFNVKQGSCEKPSLEDVTVLVQTSVLNATLDELKEHRNHTLEVMGADFEGLSFDGFLIMLLLAAIFAISIWHGWTFPALVSGMGVAMQFMDTAPIGFVGIVYLLIIGFFMEYFIGGLAGIRKRFRSGKHDEEEGSAF